MTRVGQRARWVAVGVGFLAVVAVLPAVIVSRQSGGQGSGDTLTVGPGPDGGDPVLPSTAGGQGGPTAAAGASASTSTSTSTSSASATSRPSGGATASPGGTHPATPTTVPPPGPATGTARGGDVLAARAVLPRPVATPAPAQYQEFLSRCAPLGDGRAPLAGAAVPVVFLGAPPTGPGLAPPAGAAAGRSSCLDTADRSAYWAPQLTVAGRPVDPSAAEIYYKSPVRDYTGVQPFPPGLRLEAGAPAATASWSCGADRTAALPASCPDGARLVVRLQSPGCWDGVRLDSADHRAHLAYPTSDRCPGTHPVVVPMIELKLVYPVPAGPLAARLATGDGRTFGFGFVAGWQPGALDRLVATCINRGERCGDDGTPA